MKFLLILLGALILTAATEAQTMSAHKNSANPKFLSLCDQFVKESLALSPVGASQAGYHKFVDPKTKKTVELDAELDDISAKAFDQQLRSRDPSWGVRDLEAVVALGLDLGLDCAEVVEMPANNLSVVFHRLPHAEQ